MEGVRILTITPTPKCYSALSGKKIVLKNKLHSKENIFMQGAFEISYED